MMHMLLFIVSHPLIALLLIRPQLQLTRTGPLRDEAVTSPSLVFAVRSPLLLSVSLKPLNVSVYQDAGAHSLLIIIKAYLWSRKEDACASLECAALVAFMHTHAIIALDSNPGALHFSGNDPSFRANFQLEVWKRREEAIVGSTMGTSGHEHLCGRDANGSEDSVLAVSEAQRWVER